ncbi:hypothetical protein [Cryobacterium sp. BB736]|uniref:hypothetical protein n=1 Tax=Cryobacterium sp. BB736 TaxID=2746963 RepID=UPI001873CEEA|nr:hypothetical protein [Cryobacterium sp. BB736]
MAGEKNDPLHDNDQATGGVEDTDTAYVDEDTGTGSHVYVVDEGGVASDDQAADDRHSDDAYADDANAEAVHADHREPEQLVEPADYRDDKVSTSADAVYADDLSASDGSGTRQYDTDTVAYEPAAAPVPPPITPPVAPAVRTVYVQAPVPPRAQGNRGFGVLIAALATIAFALLYAALSALTILIVSAGDFTNLYRDFLVSPLFYIPVLVFLVAMILYALIANRAAWWSWVIGSFLVAAVVYLGSIGIRMLLDGALTQSAGEAATAFASSASSAFLIIAAILAREVAIWSGAIISSRGRKVKDRNVQAREDFERESAERQAELERLNAA